MTALSYLFVPATRPERIAKAFAAGAHAVIADLEDAVDASRKGAAREALDVFLSAGGAARLQPVWVRINAVSTAWFNDDLALLKKHGPCLAGVMLSKSESSADLDMLASKVALPIMALVESARGILQLGDLCSHPQLQRLAFGSADLARDIGCADAWDILYPARMQMLLHAASAGLPAPVDGVTFALDDAQAVTDDVRRAAQAGFGAKLCIHPAQIAPAHLGFAPEAAQLGWARRVLALASAGSGAQRLDGQMVDLPVIERARQVIDRHEAAAASDPKIGTKPA